MSNEIENKKEAVFTAKVDGKEVEFKVVRPSMKQLQEAQKVYGKAFREGLEGGLLVRERLDDYLTKQNLWDAEKEMQFKTLQAEINNTEKALAKGGIKKSEAFKLAVNARKCREKVRNLVAVKRNLDENTVEAQADNTRFNYLVSATLVYNANGKPYFKDMDDYLNRADSELASEAAGRLATLMYGLDNDYEANLPENKFLKMAGYVDEKYRLINKEGKFVDEDGKLVDENGRYINEKNQFTDREGNLVDKEGNYIFEFKPFLDDDGNPEVGETPTTQLVGESSELVENAP